MMKLNLFIWTIMILLSSCSIKDAIIECDGCNLEISSSSTILYTSVDEASSYSESCNIISPTTPVKTLNTTLPTVDLSDNSIITASSVIAPTNGSGTLSSSILTSIDTASVSTTVNITNNFPDLGQECSVSIPSISISCSDSSFVVTGTDLSTDNVTSFNISMNSSQFGGLGASVSSNNISVDYFTLQQISDLESGSDDQIHQIFSYNSNLYLIANSSQNSTCSGAAGGSYTRLFRVDTTNSRLIKLTDINAAASDIDSSNIQYVEFNGVIIMSILEAGSARLYKFDGSSLEVLSDIQGGSDLITDFQVYGSRLYFIVDHSAGVRKLYRMDTDYNIQALGSSTGSSASSDNSTDLFLFNNDLFLDGELSSGAKKLFKLESATPFLSQVSNTVASTSGAGDDDLSIMSYLAFGSDLYIVMNNSNNVSKLFKFDGTSFTEFSNTRADTNAADDPSELTLYAGKLYFKATNDGTNYQLYQTDGVSIEKVVETNSGANSNPSSLIVLGSDLLFSALNSSSNSKLYKFDGTNVTQVSDLRSGNNDNPGDFKIFNSELYFSASDTNGDERLYKYDGSTIYQLTNIDAAGDDITILEEFDSRLYFKSHNSLGQDKLFVVRPN